MSNIITSKGRYSHISRLHPEPFTLIKSGIKVYEVRTNDKKRQSFKIGDQLTFIKRPNFNEEIKTQITDLIYFNNFAEMVRSLPITALGFSGMKQDDIIAAYYKYYTRDEESEFGVVAIKFKRI